MNIYVPSPFSVEVIKLMANFLTHHPGIPALIVGDFNNYLDADLEKYSTPAPPQCLGKGPTAFARLLLELGLKDVWRLKHPWATCYSCHSVSHGGRSRINLGLGKDAMLPLVSYSCYEARTVSDHSPLCVEILTSGIVKRAYWKMNPFWPHLLI